MAKHPCIQGPNRTPCGSDECNLCWLFAHDAVYNKSWGGDGKVTHAPRSPMRVVKVAPAANTPQPQPIGHGPGTELKKLLDSLGLTSSAGCDCNSKAAEMDRWGVDGCKQHRNEIAQWLRDNAKERGWRDKAKAAALAATTGIAFQLDLSDPYGSLVDLAIQRAESLHP